MGPIVLHDFQNISPRVRLAQSEITTWLCDLQSHASPERGALYARLLSRFGVKPQDIGFRSSDVDEVGKYTWKEHRIFRAEPRGTLADRMAVFCERVWERFREFYAACQNPPDHIFHVTCTGYASPSPAQRLVSQNGWRTAITHAYHMGCYAALPVVRMAKAFALEHPDFRGDIVHTELCSLHFRPHECTPEQLVVSTLFSDGFVKYSCSSRNVEEPALAIRHVRESIIPETLDAMTWLLDDEAMAMTLSRRVPELVADAITDFLRELCSQAGENWESIRRRGIFATHPGGPRILDLVRDRLHLSEEQISSSRSVLFEHGNMSSATVPYIWKRILDQGHPRGTPVISLAFGPGLTVFGALLEVT